MEASDKLLLLFSQQVLKRLFFENRQRKCNAHPKMESVK